MTEIFVSLILIGIITIICVLLIPKKKFSENFMKSLSSFNKQTLKYFADIIYYIYDTYDESLKVPIELKQVKKDMEKKFNLVNTKLLFTSSTLFEVGISNCYYTIAGIIGQIKGTNMGLIVFRGTKNTNEWIQDGSSIITVDLSKNGLYDLSPDSFPKNTKVGEGWWNYYNRAENVYLSKNNCICFGKCKNNNCVVCKNVSKIKNFSNCENPKTCNLGLQKCDSCQDDSKQLPALSEMIIEYIKENPQIESYYMTGHSLGSAVCSLSAYHIAKVFSPEKINKIYTFASPKSGNDKFVKQYNKMLENKTYRLANTKDIVTQVPPNLEHVGNNKYTFTFSKKGYTETNYHDPYTGYVNNFDLI
jgi:hypothetical protein